MRTRLLPLLKNAPAVTTHTVDGTTSHAALRRWSGAESGVTFLEILIVLAIFSIVAGITASAFFVLQPRTDSYLAAQEIRAILMRARNQAIMRGNNHFVVIENRQPGGWSYRLINDDGWTGDGELADREIYDPELDFFDETQANDGRITGPEIFAEGSIPDGIRPLSRTMSSNIEDYRVQVTFRPDGSAEFLPEGENQTILFADQFYPNYPTLPSDPSEDTIEHQLHRFGLWVQPSGNVIIQRTRTR